MKIAFIKVKSRNIINNYIPYGILSLISFLNKEFGDKVVIKYFDDSFELDIKKSIIQFSPNLIGISSITPTIKRAYELAGYFKQRGKGVVVLGGVHPSVCPQESIKYADYVIINEGEIGLTSLVRTILEGKEYPEKLIFSSNITDLNSLPPLPWDMLNRDYYLKAGGTYAECINPHNKNIKPGELITSRGCLFKCCFCHNSKKASKVRYLSAERVVSDIEYLLNKWGVNFISFHDDEFLSNKERIEKICYLIRKRGLEFQWFCHSRADNVDIETLKLIKQHGCTQIGYGFETGSAKILRFLKGKTVSIAKNKQAIRITKKAGIRVLSYIMMGTPTETVMDFVKTFYFVATNPIDFVVPLFTRAYPGTKLWDYCVEKGIFDPDLIGQSRSIMQKNNHYLNSKYIPKLIFRYLVFFFNGYVLLFKQGYSFKQRLRIIRVDFQNAVARLFKYTYAPRSNFLG